MIRRLYFFHMAGKLIHLKSFASLNILDALIC